MLTLPLSPAFTSSTQVRASDSNGWFFGMNPIARNVTSWADATDDAITNAVSAASRADRARFIDVSSRVGGNGEDPLARARLPRWLSMNSASPLLAGCKTLPHRVAQDKRFFW